MNPGCPADDRAATSYEKIPSLEEEGWRSRPDTRVTPTATHWGNYDVETRDGRIVALRPAAGDLDPSPIGPGMPAALDDAVRLRAPMIRKSWLEHGPAPAGGLRGREAFVEVAWEEALELVGRELERVKAGYGNETIYGGSYGWGSAGRFHHAQSQLHRFLAMHGGYTRSVNSYSFAALEVLLPHVIGGKPTSIFERMPLWEEVTEHGELVLAFGGLALKNTQVNHGGVGRHGVREEQRAAMEAGVKFINISPLRDDAADFLQARWIAPRPNTDVALMLGMAHTLARGGQARQGLPATMLRRMGRLPSLPDRGGRRHDSRRRMGSRHHRR